MPPLPLPGLRVTLDNLVYQDFAAQQPHKPHCFIYFITIHNDSDRPVTIQRRKWVVLEEGGQTLVVEGDGVVGKKPTIQPGESFSYNSFHLTASRVSSAKGSYLAEDADGAPVVALIPEFTMTVPPEQRSG